MLLAAGTATLARAQDPTSLPAPYDELVAELTNEPSALTVQQLVDLYSWSYDLEGRPASTRGVALGASELAAIGRRACEQLLELGDDPTWRERAVDRALWQGRHLIEEGRLRDAARTLAESRERFDGRAPGMMPWVLVQLGTVARMTGDFATAFDVLAEAQRRVASADSTAYGRPDLLCIVAGETARLYQRIGNLDRAAHWLDREQAALSGTDNVEVARAAALNAIRFSIARRDYAAARDAIEDARERLRFPAAEAAALETYLAECRMWLANDDGPDMDSAVEALVEALDAPALRPFVARHPLLRVAHRQIERGRFADADRFLERARANLADAAAETTPLSASYERAFLLAVESCAARERGDGRDELLRLLNDFRESYAAFLEVWSRTPLLEGGVGFLNYTRSAQIVGELVDHVLAVDDDVGQAFEVLTRAQALGSLARRWDASAPTASDVQRELLTEDELLLVFHPSAHRSHLFLVERSGIRHVHLAERSVLQAARDELQRAIGRTAANDAARRRLDAEARTLRDLLLPPSAREALAQSRTVTFCGLDLLGWTPVECLPVVDGRPLGTTHAVSHLPSVPVGLELVRRATPADDPFAVDLVLLAAPDHAPPVRERWPSLRPLALELSGADDPAHAYDDGRVRRALGGDATHAWLRARLAERPRALQILTHGAYDFDAERPAVMVLAADGPASDGLFRCADAERLPSPPLVVLGACGTARTPLRRGEDGVHTFAGAFLRAGARVVLSSAADLPRDSTVALTGRFHRQIAEGAPPAEALRRARASLASEPGRDHPRHHSLLQVIGLGHRPLPE